MNKVVVITGPTATGKTSVSIRLARLIDAEIISADSMQVYKYMDVGTAKPDLAERGGIPHHLIDVVEPDTPYSVARFKEEALALIKDIISRGRQPVIVGGTGQYVSSLIYNISYSDSTPDETLREELWKLAKDKGNEYLHNELGKIDSDAAARIHCNDVKRVIRAIEVYNNTHLPISKHLELSRLNPPEYEFSVYAISMDRGAMYERINKRVDMMMENGLINEVRHLVSLGYYKTNAMQGLGYKEMLWYLKGEASLEEATELLKRNTRRFAKRQLTWFRRMKEIRWLDIDEHTQPDSIVKIIHNDVASNGIIL